MLSNQMKRFTAFFLLFALMFSLMPLQVFSSEVEAVVGQETDTPMSSAPTNATEASEYNQPSETVVEENNLSQQVLSEIETILGAYGVAPGMTDAEIQAAIFALNGNQVEQAFEDIDTFIASIDALDAGEREALRSLSAEEAVITFNRFCDTLERLFTPSLLATVGNVTITDTASKVTENSDGSITVSTANSGFFGNKNNTITIASSLDNAATLSFDYTFSNCNKYTINGSTPASTSGSSGSILLDAKGTVTIYIETGAAINRTSSVTLSNISLVEASSSVDVTFHYDSALGSVSAGGSTVANGGIVEGVSPTTGIELIATPNSGVTFLGWVNEGTEELLSTESTYTLNPGQDTAIKAAFAKSGSTAWFMAGGKRLYDDLNDASDYASTAADKTVILVADGTLPAGDYTIDSGVTLLIPFDSSNTLYTTTPELTTSGTMFVNLSATYTKPTAYRTLTMASGANITINGAMSISGKQTPKQGYNGHPSGPQGFVKMESGSAITVKNGAFLYAWGYITGSGSVTVENGGTAYECFQVTDWRGGSATSTMIGDSNKEAYMVFPLSQYYVQNVEVPMTFESGSTEVGYISIIASKISYGTSVPFIGSGSMFVIDDGSITKDYIESEDRLQVDIDGTLTMSALKIDVATYSMDSEDYVLPVTNNLRININSGTTTVSQDMALLPGTEITIAEEAIFKLASGTNLYVYDADNWNGSKFVYSSRDFSPIKYAPGKTYTRVASDIVDAKITVNGTTDASLGFVYTTTGGTTDGANICSTKSGKVIINPVDGTATYQATQSSTDITYVTISLASAKLKNGDGTYVATADYSGETTFYYAHGVWHQTNSEPVITQVSAQAATCEGIGWNAYEYCSACDYTTYQEISATGHSYETWSITTAPTYTTTGTESRECTACGDTETRNFAVASVNGTEYTILSQAFTNAGEGGTVTLLADVSGDITVSMPLTIHRIGCTKTIFQPDAGYALSETTDGVITVWALQEVFYGTNIRAGDTLDLYFYLYKNTLDEEMISADGYYALVTRYKTDESGTEKPTNQKIYSSSWEAYGTDYLRFSYDGIAAKEMPDIVSVAIYTTDGKQFSTSLDESIEGYALRAWNYFKADEYKELRTTLVDMLNYGAAAQTNFSYKTSDLANEELPDGVAGSDAVTPGNDTKWITNTGSYTLSATLTAKSELDFTFYFTGITRDMNAVITYNDHYGNAKTVEVSGDAFVENGSYWGVKVPGLSIADGRQVIACKLYTGETLAAEVESSVQSYIYQVTKEDLTDNSNLKALCTALMKFIDSAYNYFH